MPNIVDFSEYYKPHGKQLEAHRSTAPYLLFGGAMGGGKSWFLCAEAVMNAMMYKGNRLVIVRKIRQVMRKTILVTFLSVCPPPLIKSFNQQDLTITFINGSVLIFMEADRSKDPLLNKIKGLEIGWAGIDESNEVAEEVFNILKTRLRWVCPDGTIPNYRIRLTTNPENCWLIPRFIENDGTDGHVFIQSKTTDNYAEDSDYVKLMRDAYKHHPQLLERYLNGAWEFGSTVAQLITNELLNFLYLDDYSDTGGLPALGVDVARYGDDECCFVVMLGGFLAHLELWSNTSTTEVARRTVAIMEMYGIEDWRVGIDVIGVGAGTVDTLIDNGYNVTPITAGAKPEIDLRENEFKFLQPFNLRAQMFMALRNDIAGRKIGGLEKTKFYRNGELVGNKREAEDLLKELGWIEYNLADAKRLKILKKEEIKKRHGKSTDKGDGLAIANWMRRKEFPEDFVPML